MLSIKFSENLKAQNVKLTEEKTSYFTGEELVIGVGKQSELTHRKRILLARQIILLAKQHQLKAISVDFKDFGLPGDVLATAFEMANYEFKRYKTLPDERPALETIVILNATKTDQDAIARGQIIGEEINESRTLANTPGGDMTPRSLAKAAKDACKGTKVTVKTLGKKEMQKLGMGAILGVAQGSSEEPQFIILEYYGAHASLKASQGDKNDVIVLVGKGITFDSGGLNIKSDNHMTDMHLDMSGGAAVIHTIVAASKLGMKKNIVGLIPAVENMPSGSSYRPGDVLRTLSGQTIEVGNTDAEGRVVLADALTYAERYQPRLVIDIATLTGAAQVALGQRASAIFGKDDAMLAQFQKFGEEVGDYVWPLPLWDEYAEEIKGTFGDWSNIGKTRWGGATHGAIFLYQFAKKYPWIHIDMAPRMLAIEGEHLAKGSAGAPIRLLVRVLEEL